LYGPCKTGSDHDEVAVVNGQLRVHGIENLRVIDAAVMLSIASANINATTKMLAERASDMLLGKPMLADETVAFEAQ
jgi:choline dehydrogenase